MLSAVIQVVVDAAEPDPLEQVLAGDVAASELCRGALAESASAAGLRHTINAAALAGSKDNAIRGKGA